MFLILLNLFFLPVAENRITCVWAKKKCKIFQKSPAAAPPSTPLLLLLPAGAANLFASLIPQSWDRNAAAADWRWRVHRSVAFIATFNMLIIILFTRNWISLGRHSSSGSRRLSHSRRSCDARCQPCCNDSRHSCRTQEVRGKNQNATNKKKKLRGNTKGNTNYMKYSNGCKKIKIYK